MRALVYMIIFFSFFDLFTQLPIISPLAKSLGATPFLTGLAVGMFSLSNVIGNVSSGFLTDKKGPYRILIVGLFTTGIVLFMYFFAATPMLLLFIRFIHGLTSGFIIPAAFTYLANATALKKKGKGAAISGAFIGLAAVVGPAFSGIVANKTSEMTVFMVSGSFMLILSFVSLFFLRSSLAVKPKKVKKQLPVRLLFKNPNVAKAFGGAFFLMFSQGVLAYMLPLKVIDLGGTMQTSGLLLSTFGIVAVLVFILPINQLFDQIKPISTLAFGMGLMGISLILVSFSHSIGILYLLLGVYGIGFAFLFPSINSLLIGATDQDNRGKAYGYFYAFFSMGVIVGSGVTGFMALSSDAGFLFTGILITMISFFVPMFREAPSYN